MEAPDNLMSRNVQVAEDEEDRMKFASDHYSSGGNRWPPQETIALLRIRSDMDTSFKDSGTLKAHLWEQVSRRMSELGYIRSAKKCKEKFENTQKYHKRTKERRSSRRNGKSYKFFEHLEALDGHPSPLPFPPPDRLLAASSAAADAVNPTSMAIDATPCSVYSPSMHFFDNSSTSTTSTTPSKEDSEGTRKKKRKLTEFFDSLMATVVEKQETLQRKFMETVERFEKDRMAREEAWKLQELKRIERELELLAKERAVIAAKDAAVVSLLQKLSNQTGPLQLPLPLPLPFPASTSERQPGLTQLPEKPMEKVAIPKLQSAEKYVPMSSSRWPKEEIEALIELRTNFEARYQDSGPKGPLWEEVSAEMKKLGYDRNPKRCKEKWENMNKYFKRVKESGSSRIRSEDSKTCPYFHQLDAIYSGKRMKVETPGSELKPEELLMHMMRRQEEHHHPESATTDDGGGGENLESEEKEESDGYRVVASNNPSTLSKMDHSPRTDDRRGSYFCPS